MSEYINKQAAVEALQKEIDKRSLPCDGTVGAVRSGVRLARNIIEDLPPVEPQKIVVGQVTFDAEEIVERIKEEYEIKDLPVCEDAISREWIKNALLKYGFIAPDMTVTELIENAPSVIPERPKGEWVSCSEPPKDRRNVFIAHGTNDFKSCCIGHYEQGMGWYEDRNFFAKPIYDCKYWCDIPELPDLGNNQFGTEVSADMRGDK